MKTLNEMLGEMGIEELRLTVPEWGKLNRHTHSKESFVEDLVKILEEKNLLGSDQIKKWVEGERLEGECKIWVRVK